MFKKKVELKITSWRKEDRTYIAEQLMSLHVKYDAINENGSLTEYHMRVDRKQLSEIVSRISSMIGVAVKMRMYDGSFAYVAK